MVRNQASCAPFSCAHSKTLAATMSNMKIVSIIDHADQQARADAHAAVKAAISDFQAQIDASLAPVQLAVNRLRHDVDKLQQGGGSNP